MRFIVLVIAIFLAAACSDGKAKEGSNDTADEVSADPVAADSSATPDEATVPEDTPVDQIPFAAEEGEILAADSGPRSFDLDSDGTAESSLNVTPCGEDLKRLCVAVLASPLLSAREISLHADTRARSSSLYGLELRTIGNHTGSSLQEVSVMFEQGSERRPGLAVVDLEARNVVAITIAPAHGLDKTRARYAYYDVAVDSKSGKSFPFHAPGLEDGPTATISGDNVSGRAVMWGYMCVYIPSLAAKAQGRCGRGFVEIATAPLDTLNGTHWTREHGAVMADVDDDGQEEIVLLFKTALVIYSAKTAKWLKTVTFDVAANSNPKVRKLFHSGRIRGITSAGRVGAKLRFVTVSGIPVGDVTDYNCAVSRYAMVVEGTAGKPETFAAKWSWYLSFASNTFEGATVSRKGDFMNKCIHRFGDARTVVDGIPTVLFNYFENADITPKCVDAQRRLNEKGWLQADYDLWVACYSALPAASKGTWRILGIKEDSGAQLFGGSNVYIWGKTSGVSLTGETLYVVEDFVDGGKTAYQFTKAAPAKKLRLMALRNKKLVEVAVLPVEGRPKILRRIPGGAFGSGSSTYYADLTTVDVDADGKLELQLENGTAVGFASDGTLVQK